MKIVPSLLTENFDEFLARLRQAELFADYVQIDLMDGVFVETRSFPEEQLNTVATFLSFEMHLMVKDPLLSLKKIDNPGLRKVIFHFESEGDHFDLIRRIKERGLAAGMAVKPETGIEEFRDLARHVDTLVFLTVDPCCYGNPFKHEVLEKVADARRLFPDKSISVDGGVSLDKLKVFFDLGVDYACVGSRIFLNGDPRENYRRFVERVKELERESNLKKSP